MYTIISTLMKENEKLQLNSKKQIEKQLISLDTSYKAIKEKQIRIVDQLQDFNRFIEQFYKQTEEINIEFNNRKELEREIIKLKKIIERRRKKDG